jgi:molybdopterin-guanine dinucleotide biosynthesis protein A
VLDRVVVLAGGGARRMGQDKLSADLAGVPLLDRLLDDLPRVVAGVPVYAVGPARPTSVPVTWVREEPAGGGPVAALACALDGLGDAALVAVLAGDQPFAATALPLLLAELSDSVDGVLARDGQGVRQPLLALYRVAGLRAAVASGAAGRSMRSVLASLRVAEVDVPAPCTLDVDTVEDLAVALQWVGPLPPEA